METYLKKVHWNLLKLDANIIDSISNKNVKRIKTTLTTHSVAGARHEHHANECLVRCTFFKICPAFNWSLWWILHTIYNEDIPLISRIRWNMLESMSSIGLFLNLLPSAHWIRELHNTNVRNNLHGYVMTASSPLPCYSVFCLFGNVYEFKI